MYLLLLCVVAVYGNIIAVPGNYTDRNSIDDDLVVGGKPIEIEQAPYQVAMFIDIAFICGGSIIRKDVVLTVAHCIISPIPHEYKFRAGSSLRESGGQLIPAEKILVHPNYNSTKKAADIALVKLTHEFILSASVAIVPLKPADAEVKDGTSLKLTGWGRIVHGGPPATKLQCLNVLKINHQQCKEVYKVITENHLCAGHEQDKNACHGDSGGPLVESGVQVGIVSFGSSVCATANKPTVYTKVSAFRTWIDSTADKLSMA